MIQNIININHTNIGKYLKDTAPYIFVDTAEIISGKSGKGLKMWTHNEWFFKCHFPKNPIVPGVFQLEGIMQVAALAIHTLQDMDGCFVYAQKNKDFEIKNLYILDKSQNTKSQFYNTSVVLSKLMVVLI